MYCYCFQKNAWFDRIFKVSWVQWLKSWDLFYLWTDVFLNLGEEIPFQDLYKYELNLEWIELDNVLRAFLSKKVIDIILYMVYTYYTKFSKVIPLFIDFDLKYLYKLNSKKQKPVFTDFEYDYNENVFEYKSQPINWQVLYVFPDIFTMKNFIEKNKPKDSYTIKYSQNSSLQNFKVFEWLRNWSISSLFSSPSWIYNDYYKLKKIILFYSYKWYYKSQQDPRYLSIDVVKKISELNKSELIMDNFLIWEY